MIHYRDMTFCRSNCQNTECTKHESHQRIEIRPERLRDLPTSWKDYSKGCSEYLPKEATNDPR